MSEFCLLVAKCYYIYSENNRRSVELIDTDYALLIYITFFARWFNALFSFIVIAIKITLAAHAIFIIVAEIALLVMEIREYFDKK